jgi:hypothetical protein
VTVPNRKQPFQGKILGMPSVFTFLTVQFYVAGPSDPGTNETVAYLGGTQDRC